MKTDTGTGDQGPGIGENPTLQAEGYYLGRAWWWPGPSGKVRIGVVDAYRGAWMIGWINPKTGGRHKFSSVELRKWQLTRDPAAVLKGLTTWAVQRELKGVE